MRWAEPNIKNMFDRRNLNEFKASLPRTSLNHQDFKHTFEHMFNEINVAKGKMDPKLLDYLNVFCNQYEAYLAAIIDEPHCRFKSCYLARAIQYDNLELAKFLMSKGASVKSNYASISDQRRGDQRTIEEVISDHQRFRKELLPESRKSKGFMCCGGRPRL